MISHLTDKPDKEKMLQAINRAAKVEFEFLMHGVKAELIGYVSEDLIQFIDKKTKSLKMKVIWTEFLKHIGNY